MSENGEKKTKTIAEIVGNYPAKDLPVIFADFVPATGRQAGTVKFYLMRTDPSISADSTFNPQLVAQIIMPAVGFASTAVFFENELAGTLRKSTCATECASARISCQCGQ